MGRKLVLVAEDDDDLRGLLATVLSKDGHAVVEAPDGAAMLDYVRGAMAGRAGQPLPAAVIADVRMPRHDGLTALASLRRAGFRRPALLISAYADEETRVVAARLATPLLAKPLDLDALRAEVRRMVASPPAG